MFLFITLLQERDYTYYTKHIFTVKIIDIFSLKNNLGPNYIQAIDKYQSDNKFGDLLTL